MKAVTELVVLFAVFASCLLAPTQEPPLTTPLPHPIQVSAKAAEKLLRQKVEICYPSERISRVTGTVVLAIEIDKNGNVLHPTFVSGPAMLRTSVLDAVEKHYKYKPYLQNGRAVDVETTVSVFVGLQCRSSTPYWIH
jgi:outer membrane biosynthesis protein TonB